MDGGIFLVQENGMASNKKIMEHLHLNTNNSKSYFKIMEGDSSGHIEKLNKPPSKLEHDDSSIFQPSWVRRNPILANDNHWKSLVRQFSYVCYGGIILWIGYLISVAVS
jgi:hypothetical protein